MPLLVIRCSERDLALAVLKLTTDLAVDSFMVGLDSQQDVDSLLQAPSKNPCVV